MFTVCPLSLVRRVRLWLPARRVANPQVDCRVPVLPRPESAAISVAPAELAAFRALLVAAAETEVAIDDATAQVNLTLSLSHM